MPFRCTSVPAVIDQMEVDDSQNPHPQAAQRYALEWLVMAAAGVLSFVRKWRAG